MMTSFHFILNSKTQGPKKLHITSHNQAQIIPHVAQKCQMAYEALQQTLDIQFSFQVLIQYAISLYQPFTNRNAFLTHQVLIQYKTSLH